MKCAGESQLLDTLCVGLRHFALGDRWDKKVKRCRGRIRSARLAQAIIHCINYECLIWYTDTHIIVPDHKPSSGQGWLKRLSCSRCFGTRSALTTLSCCYPHRPCGEHFVAWSAIRPAPSCQEALLSPRGGRPARHTEPATCPRANSSLGFQSCELQLRVQDRQQLDPHFGAACSSPGMHYNSAASSSCFLSGLTFIFMRGSLQEENMRNLNSSWVHFTCDTCSCASILQGQCGASGEKGDACAAFFLWRWANVRVRISKLSQPKDRIFNFHEWVVLAVLQKGTFQNSRVWGEYIWSLTSWTAFSVIAQTTSLWISASKFSLHSPSLVFQSYIYKAITWQHLHESRFLLGIYRAS